jgi:hypothetical protein
MFSLVRRFIKTGIVFLFGGVALGVWILISREIFGVWPSPYLVSAHAHAVLAGFVMFLILGVALWLFPRPEREDPRYTPGRISAAYWTLTLSTSVRLLSEVAHLWSPAPQLGWALVLGGIGQAVGLGIYFHAMWGRIRPVGSHLREAKGERF